MRSFLFVPADDERKIGKALCSQADAVILDLEDSVAEARKPYARACLSSLFQTSSEASRKGGPALFIRLNPLESPHFMLDLEVLSSEHAGYDGIVQPKANGAASVATFYQHLPHPKPILAIATETPRALFSLGDYAEARPFLFGLTWGAEDLSHALGAHTSRDEHGHLTDPYRLARSLCLFGAKAIDVDAIDTVFVSFRDHQGLEAECRQASRDGFSGKMAIHPNQITTINTCFTPSPQEIACAQEVVQAFQSAENDIGVLTLDGKMYDLPHLHRAEKVLARAARYGGQK